MAIKAGPAAKRESADVLVLGGDGRLFKTSRTPFPKKAALAAIQEIERMKKATSANCTLSVVTTAENPPRYEYVATTRATKASTR